MIPSSFIGKEYPAVSFFIGREKLKDFLVATKANQEQFSEIVPPTFPVVYSHELLGAVLFDQELNLNLFKLVHGEQEFVYHNPAKVGDTITSTGIIEKIFQKGPHDFVVFKSSSVNQLGDKVCDQTWTFIVRGGNDRDFSLVEKLSMKVMGFLPANPADKAKREKAYQSLKQKTDVELDLSKAKQDMQNYEKFANRYIGETYIDKYMPQVYAGASGDFNVIHLDEAFGRSVGLGTNILHGMATMALGANFAMIGQDPSKIKSYKARFSNPVKPMDTISYHGEINDNAIGFKAINQNDQEVLNQAILELHP